MNINASNPKKFTYPPKRLLKLSGVIPIEEMCNPKQINEDGNKCIAVLKNGISSGTTIGHTIGICWNLFFRVFWHEKLQKPVKTRKKQLEHGNSGT